MKLYLVRHGETQYNRDHLVQGRSPTGLTELGVRQAMAAAEALAQEGIAALYSSPLNRAVETSTIIGGRLGLSVHLEEGLSEMDTGELDGLTSQEMRAQYPEFMAQWRQDAGAAHLPGGESLAEVQERAWKAVEDIVRRHPEENVVAVSHNFTLCALVCKALGLPLAGFHRLRVDLGSLSALDFSPQRDRLVLLNSTFHLAEVGATTGGLRT
ncbi:MAG: histidine phosphatase family protein [Chloroflexi bacterium]|nr:histidine phosphatase family protein [Chloroflexota bacterium]